MRLKYPVSIGFAEKIIQTNLVQGFLHIFRKPDDIHRVLSVIPITLLISHSAYMLDAPSIKLTTASFSEAEILWLILFALPPLFWSLWTIFSSVFNPALYVRQAIFVIWTGLAHRWACGLEIFGTPYLTAVSLIALTSYLPFAFWGLRPDQLFSKLQDEYRFRKEAGPPVVQQAKSDSMHDAA